MDKLDTTRRTRAQAQRMPQWQRLITSVHDAQGQADYAGREFGDDEMRFFGSSLIGRPVEHVAISGKPGEFSAYWVERQSMEHSDRTVTVAYVLKAVYGDNLASVQTISRDELTDPTADQDANAALDAVRRAHSIAGRWVR